MKILIGADHAGYDYKEKIKTHLEDKDVEVEDIGAPNSEATDYPEYAHRVAEHIRRNREDRGILICGSGLGMSITANRYTGVRATLCLNKSMVTSARKHNNSNCLVLGQRLTDAQTALEMVDEFLSADFDGGRHQRRLHKIDEPPLRVIGHPLVQTKLSHLRNEGTPNKKFRELLTELTGLMFYEVTCDFPTTERIVQTPVGDARGKDLLQNILLVPILRAGLGMVDPILKLVPTARVGHVGLYRDEETLEPVEYYLKLPENLDRPAVSLLDPMLATGGSAAKAISLVKEEGFTESLRFLCLVAAPEGIKKVHEEHPDVSIYTASVDRGLDEDGYIDPGLGDAGDRLFGTV